jgi:uncharacterized RDD family membrane protein YckC
MPLVLIRRRGFYSMKVIRFFEGENIIYFDLSGTRISLRSWTIICINGKTKMNDVIEDQATPAAIENASEVNTRVRPYEYAGFWVRAVASIIDTIVILIITSPFLYWIYGAEMLTSTDLIKGAADVLLSYIFPLIFTIALWMKFGGTPGKRLLKIKVLDEKTGQYLSLSQSLLRYFGYFVSIIGLFIGFIWIAFDSKKKGWHDHIAGTVVVIG